MKWSKTHLFTLKDAPSDADIESQRLMIRAGMIKKVAPGIYTYGLLALRAIRKFEQIIREELNRAGCQEVLMPMVQPKNLWQQSRRWDEMGDTLLRFKNRVDQEFCLGPTHEEVITDYVRHDIKSYRDLPVNLYQIQTKYRDEIRPRFGLMRGREFIMKDAYSFDCNKESALESYKLMHRAYCAIFDRLGLDYRVVSADSGSIGGDTSQEFQVLAEAGEDHLMISDGDDFAANIEVAPAIDADKNGDKNSISYNGGGEGCDLLPLEKFDTPKLRTIKDLSHFLSVKDSFLIKTMFFKTPDPISVLLKGDDEVNLHKIKNLLGLSDVPVPLSHEEVRGLTGASPGSCGPVGLKIPIYMDQAMESYKNYVVGANEDDVHLKNVNHGRDFQVTKVADLRMAKEGQLSPSGKGKLQSVRGIEVGHIFYLGPKYSEAMDAKYLDENGKQVAIEMGCYGIGVTRTVQSSIEQSRDKDGIIWPVSITPFHIHVCVLDPEDSEVMETADKLYQSWQEKGVEVFMDDRKVRPGVKFKDADLLGFPLRLVIGQRDLKEGKLPLSERQTGQKTFVSVEDLGATVVSWLQEKGVSCS